MFLYAFDCGRENQFLFNVRLHNGALAVLKQNGAVFNDRVKGLTVTDQQAAGKLAEDGIIYTTKHTSTNDRKIKCPDENCVKTFVKNNDKNVHVESVHLGIRYVCPHDQIQYTGRRYLQDHLMKRHADIYGHFTTDQLSEFVKTIPGQALGPKN
jgi:hypothetical protein